MNDCTTPISTAGRKGPCCSTGPESLYPKFGITNSGRTGYVPSPLRGSIITPIAETYDVRAPRTPKIGKKPRMPIHPPATGVETGIGDGGLRDNSTSPHHSLARTRRHRRSPQCRRDRFPLRWRGAGDACRSASPSCRRDHRARTVAAGTCRCDRRARHIRRHRRNRRVGAAVTGDVDHEARCDWKPMIRIWRPPFGSARSWPLKQAPLTGDAARLYGEIAWSASSLPVNVPATSRPETRNATTETTVSSPPVHQPAHSPCPANQRRGYIGDTPTASGAVVTRPAVRSAPVPPAPAPPSTGRGAHASRPVPPGRWPRQPRGKPRPHVLRRRSGRPVLPHNRRKRAGPELLNAHRTPGPLRTVVAVAQTACSMSSCPFGGATPDSPTRPARVPRPLRSSHRCPSSSIAASAGTLHGSSVRGRSSTICTSHLV